MGLYESENLDNIRMGIKDIDKSMKTLSNAFVNAQDSNEQRVQAMKDLTERVTKLTDQVAIGNAMEALRYGFKAKQFGENAVKMYDAYELLSTRAIEDAVNIVNRKSKENMSQRGTEFDDEFQSEENKGKSSLGLGEIVF